MTSKQLRTAATLVAPPPPPRSLVRHLASIGSKPVAVACMLALVSGVAGQSWFRWGMVIASGDNLPAGFLNPDRVLDAGGRLWGTSITPTGGADFHPVLQTVPALVGKAIALLGAAPDVAQRVFLSLTFAGLAPAMFLLLSTLLPARGRLAGAIAGSLFYAFNPALLAVVPNAVYLVALVLLPLLPALVLRGSGRSGWRYPAAFGLASALLSYVFANPPMASVVLAACSVTLVASARTRPRGTASFALRSFLLAVPLNLWWILPAAFTLSGTGDSSVVPGGDISSWAWTHARSSLVNVVALTPVWAWPDPIYFPFAPTLERAYFVGLRLLLSLSALAAPLVVPRHLRRKALAVTLAALAMVLLAKGLHSPLTGVNAFLYRHLPGMWLFREPASKFTLALACLLAIGLALLVSGLQAPLVRRGAAAVFVLVTFAVSYPLWTGAVIPDRRPLLPPAHVQIPDWWWTAAEFLNARPGRVLLLPPNNYYQMPYWWGFYGADVFADELIESPVIRLLPVAGNAYLAPDSHAQAVLDELRRSVEEGAWRQAARLARVLQIRWILVRGDIDSNFPGRQIQNPAALARGIGKSAAFRRVRDFGPLTLFALAKPPLGRVWATNRAVVSSEDETSLPALGRPDRLATLPESAISQLPPGTLTAIPAEAQRVRAEGARSRGGSIPSGDALRVFYGTGAQLLSDPSFEEGTWGRVLDCNASDERSPKQVGLRADRIRAGTEGRFALALSADDHAACVSQRVTGFDPEAAYRISLDHLRQRGARPRLCVWQEGPDRCADLPPLQGGEGWRHDDLVFRPDRGTHNLDVLLYADGRPGGTTVLYDNIRLERIGPVPDVALQRLSYSGRDAAPRIRATRVSPVEYRVSVQGATKPFLLVLNETFDAGWRLTGDPSATHLRANGFANGWIVRAPGDLELSLVYEPQRWVDRARMLSAASIPTVLMLLIVPGLARRARGPRSGRRPA